MNSIPKLIIIGGPSGAGKTSTASYISKKYQNMVHYREQLTTRKPRDYELAEKPYVYLSDEEFEVMDKRGEIVIKTDFVDHFYAYDTRFVESLKMAFKQGKSVVVDSIHSIHDWIKFSKDTGTELITIFLYSEDINLLRNRVKTRQQIDEISLNKRMEHAGKCLVEGKYYHYTIDTTSFDSLYQKLDQILNTPRECNHEEK